MSKVPRDWKGFFFFFSPANAAQPDVLTYPAAPASMHRFSHPMAISPLPQLGSPLKAGAVGIPVSIPVSSRAGSIG